MGEILVWFDNKHMFDEQLNAAKAEGKDIYFEAIVKETKVFAGKPETQIVVSKLITEQEFFEGAKVAEEKGKQMEQAKAALPQLAPGQKLDLELTVMDIRQFEGFQGGTTTIYKFVDQFGRRFFWKTSTRQELEQGKTYKVKASVGWEKQPGSNKPALDAQGNKQLAHDKYDPESVKLDKVEPLEVGGQKLVTKQDVKGKGRELAVLQEAAGQEYEKLKAIDEQIRALESVSAADIRKFSMDVSGTTVSMEAAQKEIAALAAEMQKAQAAKAAGAPEYKPDFENLEFKARHAYEELTKRPVTPADVKKILEEQIQALEQKIQAVLVKLPGITTLADQWQAELQAQNQTYSPPIDNKYRAQIEKILNEIGQSMSSLVTGEHRRVWWGAKSYRDFADSLRMSLQDNGELKELKQTLPLAVQQLAEGKQVWERPQYLWHTNVPTTMPKTVTPDEFVQMATRLIEGTRKAMEAVPALVEQYKAQDQVHKAAEARYRQAEGEYVAMQDQQRTGRPRQALQDWVLKNCRFAQLAD